MIKFESADLESVKDLLAKAANQSTFSLLSLTPTEGYTSSPSLLAAFKQHNSTLVGQGGALATVFQKIYKDIFWLASTFDVHTHALLEQETANESMLDNLYNGTDPIMDLGLIGAVPTRDLAPVQNLAYVTPPGVAEATMPLQALIAMFSSDDSAPLFVAEQWKSAGDRLEETLHQLHQASTTIAARTTGLSFDAARTAINDITTTGNIIVTNTRLMEHSVRQFPIVRTTNLTALQTIQATTATITEPAERLAAEQAAIAHYTTTTLQPSLDTLTPPVTNLTIPTPGHTGGGNLNTHTGGPTNTRLDIHHITGNPTTPTATTTPQPLADQATHTANTAGHTNPTAVSPSTTPASPVQTPTAADTPVNPSGLATPPAGGPTSLAGQTVTNPAAQPGPTGGLPTAGFTGTPPATPTPGSTPRGHTTTPRNGGGAVGGRMASGTGTVRLPPLPYSATLANPNAGSPAVTPGHPTTNAPGMQGNSTTQSGTGTSNNASTRGMAGGGMFGGAGAGRGGTTSGRTGTTNTSGKFTKTSAAVRDYFYRQFMAGAPKQKKVRQIITRG